MKIIFHKLLSLFFSFFPTELFVRACLFLPGTFIIYHINKHGGSINPSVKIEPPIFWHNYDNNKRSAFINLYIDKESYIGKRAFFDLSNKIVIENNCTIAMNVSLITHTDTYNSSLKLKSLPKTTGEITIRNNAYLGVDVTILESVTIGESSIIGAKSLVTKSVPGFSLAYGIPCKVQNNL
jgi:acetyltransferase-like isoleucine patch superfamily enzyme